MRKKIQQKSGKTKQSKKTDKRIIQVTEGRCKIKSQYIHSKTENEAGKTSGNTEGNDLSAEKSRFNVRVIFIFPFIVMIRAYKICISPLLPPSCRFTPTCSEYAEIALKKHGLIYGLILTCYRLLRCQPFCKGGYDPVPEKCKKKNTQSKKK